MPLPMEYSLKKTKDHSEFEDMVCDVCTKKFGISFQRFGRPGQQQFGIDIIATGLGEKICIQCKNYDISFKNLEEIIEKASQFKQPMSKFMIATSSSRDTKLQEYILEINHKGGLKFEVDIIFWEEISMIISQNNDLLEKYYPVINTDLIEQLVSEFNGLMYTCHVFDFLTVDPVVGMPADYPGHIDEFVFSLGDKLKKCNSLQQQPKFIAVNSFKELINQYNGYLAIKLFPANNMYTIQNPFDLDDIRKDNSQIKETIYYFKRELDILYEQINNGCSLFYVS